MVTPLAPARTPGEARARCRASVLPAILVLLERTLDLAWKGVAEDRCVEAPGVLNAGLRVHGIDVEPLDGFDQIADAAVPVTAGNALAHRLERTAAAGRDRRTSGGLSLDGRDAELLGTGHDKRLAGLQQPRALFVGNTTRERDGWSRQPAQSAHVRAVTDDQQRALHLVEGLHRHVDPLVRHQLGQHQVLVAYHARGKPARVDRRMDHRRLAAEVRADPRLRRARVRDVAVDALCRDPVPLAPAPEQ